MSHVSHLMEIEAELRAAGFTVADLCREAGVARSTWQRWAKNAHQPNFGTWGSVLDAKNKLLAADPAGEAAA